MRRLSCASYLLSILVTVATSKALVAEDGGAPHQPGRLSTESHVFETDTHGEVNAELGKLVVVESRSRAGSRTIELAFVRLPTRSEQPGPPIVYLAGGPGGSGIRAGQGARFRLFDALRDSGDVILFDQRGTGRSTRIDPEECDHEAQYPLDRPLKIAPYLALVESTAAACAREWKARGVDLDAYTTEDSAADVEALRIALGAQQFDLLGISYGSHLAMAYMRLYPERVRRVVLAGAEGPDHTVKLPSQFDSQLEKLEDLLSEDVRPLIRQVLEATERAPVTLRIIDVDGPDSETRLVVGRRDLEAVTMGMLLDPGKLVQVPAVYERLASGDFTDISWQIEALREIGDLEAMPEAMDAASGLSAARLERLEREDRTTLLGSGVLLANLATIRGLGVRDLGPAFRGPLSSAAPTLFISGSLDGRTPSSNAEELLAGFPQGRHVIVRNGGHSDDLLIATPELERLIVDFFLDRETTETEIALPAPDPTAARIRAPLTSEQARRYVGEYERRDREIWRILHHKTIETLDASGEVRFANAVLQIRWAGNGFPFFPVSETLFYIDFPSLIAVDFRFEFDEAGGVTHLVFEDGEGRTVRMEKVH